MTRVKKGVHALKRRRSVLKQTKGFRHGRKSKERQAKEALLHAGNYSFAHRKDKKSFNRKLWNIKINAGARAQGLSYSKLINGLKKKNILDKETVKKEYLYLAEKYHASERNKKNVLRRLE